MSSEPHLSERKHENFIIKLFCLFFFASLDFFQLPLTFSNMELLMGAKIDK